MLNFFPTFFVQSFFTLSFITFFPYIINANNSLNEVKYNDINNFEYILNNLFKSDNDLKQANISDNNVNQSLYLDKEDFILPPRRNNLPHILDDTTSIVEFDLIQLSPPPKPIVNNIFLAKSANLEVTITRKICIKILELDFVCQAINE